MKNIIHNYNQSYWNHRVYFCDEDNEILEKKPRGIREYSTQPLVCFFARLFGLTVDIKVQGEVICVNRRSFEKWLDSNKDNPHAEAIKVFEKKLQKLVHDCVLQQRYEAVREVLKNKMGIISLDIAQILKLPKSDLHITYLETWIKAEDTLKVWSQLSKAIGVIMPDLREAEIGDESDFDSRSSTDFEDSDTSEASSVADERRVDEQNRMMERSSIKDSGETSTDRRRECVNRREVSWDVTTEDSVREEKIDSDTEERSSANRKRLDFEDRDVVLRELEKLKKHLNSFKEWCDSRSEQLSEITELDLFNLNLSHLPEEICMLTNLQSLNLMNNALSELPGTIGQLQHLKILLLNKNTLSRLPKEICSLQSLEQLYAHNNKLRFLPRDVGNLKSLTHLSLKNNGLSSLPKTFKNLHNLQILCLEGNNFKIFPQEIIGLVKVKHLFMNYNRLAEIPEGISELKSLQVLVLSENQLSSVPDTLGKLDDLTRLYLGGNSLRSLPESFTELKSLRLIILQDNNFKTIPRVLKEMPKLSEVALDSNLLKRPIPQWLKPLLV